MAPNNPDAKAHMQQVQQKLGDLGEQHLADMDAAGIDVQVLSFAGILMDKLECSNRHRRSPATPTKPWREWSRAHPTRFAAFAALNPKEPEEAAHEFRRCVLEMGFVGAMVDGMTDGLFLDDPRFAPIFDAAVELGVPVYLHPAPPPESVQQAYYSGLPDGVGQLLSIAGWGWHVETGLHALRLDRLRPVRPLTRPANHHRPHGREPAVFHPARSNRPVSQRPELEQTDLGVFQNQLPRHHQRLFHRSAVRMRPGRAWPERILFSVDYPFSSNEVGVKFLDSLPISSEDKEMIAHGNAERLLNLNG